MRVLRADDGAVPLRARGNDAELQGQGARLPQSPAPLPLRAAPDDCHPFGRNIGSWGPILYLLLLKLNSRGSVTRSAEENPLPCSCMDLLFYTVC